MYKRQRPMTLPGFRYNHKPACPRSGHRRKRQTALSALAGWKNPKVFASTTYLSPSFYLWRAPMACSQLYLSSPNTLLSTVRKQLKLQKKKYICVFSKRVTPLVFRAKLHIIFGSIGTASKLARAKPPSKDGFSLTLTQPERAQALASTCDGHL